MAGFTNARGPGDDDVGLFPRHSGDLEGHVGGKKCGRIHSWYRKLVQRTEPSRAGHLGEEYSDAHLI